MEDESGSTVSHFLFQQGSLSIPAGKRLAFVNGKPGHSGSNAEDSGVEFDVGYALGGTGTIRRGGAKEREQRRDNEKCGFSDNIHGFSSVA